MSLSCPRNSWDPPPVDELEDVSREREVMGIPAQTAAPMTRPQISEGRRHDRFFLSFLFIYLQFIFIVSKEWFILHFIYYTGFTEYYYYSLNNCFHYSNVFTSTPALDSRPGTW